MSREFIYFVFFPVKKIKIYEFVRCEDKEYFTKFFEFLDINQTSYRHLLLEYFP